MKYLKKIFFFTLALFPFMIFSQNGFIEIEVRDSIQVKAVSFEYVIFLEEDYGIYNEDVEADEKINEMKSKNQEKMRLNNLESFLKNNRYKYISLSDSNYEVNGRSSVFRINNGYKVTLSSINELKKIANEIKQMSKISGTISKINYEDASSREEELLKKLIEKGRGKAQSIAKLSNLALGKIIEIKELNGSDNANLNFMDMIMKLDKKRNLGMTAEIQYSNYSKALLIKFKAE